MIDRATRQPGDLTDADAFKLLLDQSVEDALDGVEYDGLEDSRWPWNEANLRRVWSIQTYADRMRISFLDGTETVLLNEEFALAYAALLDSERVQAAR